MFCKDDLHVSQFKTLFLYFTIKLIKFTTRVQTFNIVPICEAKRLVTVNSLAIFWANTPKIGVLIA